MRGCCIGLVFTLCEAHALGIYAKYDCVWGFKKHTPQENFETFPCTLMRLNLEAILTEYYEAV